MDDAPPDVTAGARCFRPRSAPAAAAAWGLVSLGWLALAVTDTGAAGLANQLPWVVLVGALVWAVLVRPAVFVGPHGVRLRNPWRDVDVPWSALTSVETRFALTLRTADGRSWSAWAAPASGRLSDPRMTRSEVAALALDDEAPTASASWSSSSGAVAAWIRRERRRAAADLDQGQVTTRVAVPVVVLLAGSAAASLLTLLV